MARRAVVLRMPYDAAEGGRVYRRWDSLNGRYFVVADLSFLDGSGVAGAVFDGDSGVAVEAGGKPLAESPHLLGRAAGWTVRRDASSGQRFSLPEAAGTDGPFVPAPSTRPLFPPEVVAILEAPDALEVFSLDPNSDLGNSDDFDDDRPGTLRGWRIRGGAAVPTPARRLAVGRALVAANRTFDRWTMCFDPRHGVRATRDGQSVVLVICFHCGAVQVVGVGPHTGTYPDQPLGRTGTAARASPGRGGLAVGVAAVAGRRGYFFGFLISTSSVFDFDDTAPPV